MYAKIFAQIYDGSLCTRGPWEALVTFQQMLVLADQDGTVDMTVEAMARRTTIPLAIIKKGVAALLLPDTQSRTPTEDGRRIVLLSDVRDWGWSVVNYAHYRQLKRELDRREYHQNYWNKNRSGKTASTDSTDSTPLKALNTTQTTQPNQPIAEAYANAEAINGVTKPTGFDAFYEAYPRKVGKAAAIKAFAKANANAFISIILEDIDHRVCNGEWGAEKVQFIPYPATYLSGKRWEDEHGIGEQVLNGGVLPGAI
jgi:hypothetical protein